MGKSYGLIEVPSTTAAIDALDIMCKTADVEFVTWEKKLKEKYEEGYTILLDRYTTSSIIYQSCLIEDLEERKKLNLNQMVVTLVN